MDFLPPGTFDRGVIGGVLLGMGWFVLVSVWRSARYIGEFGFWRWLGSALRIEQDSLGLILVLLLLLLVTVLVFPPLRVP